MIWADVKAELKKLALIVATIVVLVFIGYQFIEAHRRNAGSDRARADIHQSQQLDTAHVARHDSSARIDSAVHTLTRIGTTATVEANRIHRVADTTGQHAVTVRDSLVMWHTRDSLHLVEIDSLHARIRSDSLQKILLTADRDKWKVHSDSLVDGMDRLRVDLKKAHADQCRLLPFVPCLSRKESLILGATAGALIAAHPKQTVEAVRKVFTLGR